MLSNSTAVVMHAERCCLAHVFSRPCALVALLWEDLHAFCPARGKRSSLFKRKAQIMVYLKPDCERFWHGRIFRMLHFPIPEITLQVHALCSARICLFSAHPPNLPLVYIRWSLAARLHAQPSFTSHLSSFLISRFSFTFVHHSPIWSTSMPITKIPPSRSKTTVRAGKSAHVDHLPEVIPIITYVFLVSPSRPTLFKHAFLDLSSHLSLFIRNFAG